MGKNILLLNFELSFLLIFLLSIIENVLKKTPFREIGFARLVKCLGKDEETNGLADDILLPYLEAFLIT